MIFSEYLEVTLFRNEPVVICLHTEKWFQVYLTQIIPFYINHLFAHSLMISKLYTQLKVSSVIDDRIIFFKR